jgi:RimJ/RimL family protein N-acetyltransferase
VGVSLGREISDGVVTLRGPTAQSVPTLVGQRDAVSRRFVGERPLEPDRVAVIVVDGRIVGWVDYDDYGPWLKPDEVNLCYNVFATERGNGYATRVVRTLIQHLITDTTWLTATLLIDQTNRRSLALADRLAFKRYEDPADSRYWKRSVTPQTWRDSPLGGI